jgi:hypothetical protein
LAEIYETYKDQGLIIVTLLVETLAQEPPSVDDLNLWVDEYEITHPVVSDPEWGVVERYSIRDRPALPSHTLIAHGMEIIEAAGEVDESDIEAILPGR